MGKRFFFLIVLIIGTSPLFAQLLHPDFPAEEPTSKVHWMNFKEAFEANKKTPKPFLIDVYTDWCGWCKRMMATTYSNPYLANYINQNFYPVKFNAETKDSIYFKDTLYVNTSKGSRPVHQLTYKLMGNQLSYPTTIFLFNELKNQANIPGYLDEKNIEPILIYFIENVYMNCGFQEFNQYFTNAFLDTEKMNKNVALKKYTFEESERLNQKQKRKWLINMNTDWCNACRVMKTAVYTDSAIAAYLNKNYYYIDFNVQTKDTIRLMNSVYNYSKSTGMPINTLALALSGNQIILPTTIILDEEMKKLDALPRFYTPQMLKPVLHFYGDDAYKTTTWDDFRKKFKQ